MAVGMRVVVIDRVGVDMPISMVMIIDVLFFVHSRTPILIALIVYHNKVYPATPQGGWERL